MGAARRKLHEQRGASMLMALLLLLVALTVSAVVIAAASSAAATLRSDKAREQSSLAVSSAAEYVRDAFLHGEMDGTVKADNNTTYTSSGSGAFLGFVQYAVPVLYKGSKANDHWTYKLSLEGMEDVWAVFSMTYGDNKGAADEGKAYILTVALRNYEDDAAPGEHPCRMTLTLYSNLKSQSGGQTVNWNGHNVIE
ncbi:MAG: hypothetical protein EGQ56_05340 [Clostridiales bacterium]|nr:hypothetical protein [Clostridiales bacterium]